MDKIFSKLHDLTKAEDIINFIDRISVVDKITICHNGDILMLEGCPRGLDITVGLKAYMFPELLDEDLEIGCIYIKDRYSDDKNSFNVTEGDLRDIYSSILGLMRRWYLGGLDKKDKLRKYF